MSVRMPEMKGTLPVSRGTLPPAPAGGYDLDSPYTLLPGDVIEIVVLDDPTLNVQLEIPPDGRLRVWQSDTDGKSWQVLEARGMTLHEMEEKIAAIYGQVRFQKTPYVQVKLASAVQRKVYFMGPVNSPSLDLPKQGRLTLARAIQMGGGVREEGDLREVRISRKDPVTGTEVSLPMYDVELIAQLAAYDRDPPLEPNDIITVGTVGTVSIFGNINSPNRYLLKSKMTILDLFAVAGGLKPFSKLSSVRVIRDEGQAGEQTYMVDVGAILDGSERDRPLQAGDRVWIDEDWK
jgi:protein involved in polysaccharide export with SLBB domain